LEQAFIAAWLVGLAQSVDCAAAGDAKAKINRVIEIFIIFPR